YPVHGTVSYSQYGAYQFVTAAQLRVAAGATSTARIDGVAVPPNGKDFVYAIHTDTAGKSVFLKVDFVCGAVTRISDSDTISEDVSAATEKTFALAAGFDYSAPGDRLVFGDTGLGATANMGLLNLSVGTGQTQQSLRAAQINGLQDLSINQNGVAGG